MEKFEWKANVIVEGVLPAKLPKAISKDCVLEKRIDGSRAVLFITILRQSIPSPKETEEVRKIALERAERFANLYSLAFGGLRALYVESVNQVTPYKETAQFLQTFRLVGGVSIPDKLWVAKRKLLEKAEKIPLKQYQSIALSHYSLALWLEEAKSSFLNAMICIESLYNDFPIELRYRMAHRIANLLGRTEELRQRIFKEFSKLYSKRNKLIHGQKPVIVSSKDRELLLVYSKHSLIAFLELNQKKLDLLKEIDEAIYDGGKRKEIQERIKGLLKSLEQKMKKF